MDHSYEEIRNVVLDIIARRERTAYEPSQFQHLLLGVAEVFDRRAGNVSSGRFQQSHPTTDLTLEVFWDLFRQGIITRYCLPPRGGFRMVA
jgi:hypothetical protein